DGSPRARAARALLPHARLTPRRGGRAPGDAPPRVAPSRRLRGPQLLPRLALQDRDERLPALGDAPRSPADAARARRDPGGAAPAALPRRAARRARRRRGEPGRALRPAGERPARVPRRDPAPAAAPAGGAPATRRARLVDERGLGAAR